MADNSELITASQDGALYDVLANQRIFIISGIGNNMTVGNNTTSLNVTLATGECVIRGRHITNTAPITLQLSPNTTGVLCLRLNTSNNSASFMTIASEAALTNGNVNNSGTTADLLLGTYATNASGVSSYTDKRVVISGIYQNANSSTAGLMSAADKSKLDGIAAGRQVNSVTGVKGTSESSYRTGNVNLSKANIGLSNVENYSLAQIKSNITKADIGLENVENKSSATIRSEITAQNVINALGYSPSNGVVIAYQATSDRSDMPVQDSNLTLVMLTDSGAKISGSGMSVEYQGIKVSTSGLYRISGSVYVEAPAATYSYGVYLKKANNQPASSASEIGGILFAKPTNTSFSGAAQIAPKLYSLSANDIIYLYARIRGGSGTYQGANNMTYLLVEKVS